MERQRLVFWTIRAVHYVESVVAKLDGERAEEEEEEHDQRPLELSCVYVVLQKCQEYMEYQADSDASRQQEADGASFPALILDVGAHGDEGLNPAEEQTKPKRKPRADVVYRHLCEHLEVSDKRHPEAGEDERHQAADIQPRTGHSGLQLKVSEDGNDEPQKR